MFKTWKTHQLFEVLHKTWANTQACPTCPLGLLLVAPGYPRSTAVFGLRVLQQCATKRRTRSDLSTKRITVPPEALFVRCVCVFFVFKEGLGWQGGTIAVSLYTHYLFTWLYKIEHAHVSICTFICVYMHIYYHMSYIYMFNSTYWN